jgi:cytochrome o ubiquinol oxidase operon protein cyoD
MSDQTPHAVNRDPHADQPSHDEAQAHGSYKSYLTGFALSVLLTAIPFWLVMSGVLGNPQTTALVILLFAVAQIVVHMIFFLHMTTRLEGGWTMLALIFTIVIVGIAFSGSVWVMYHLDTNMMPMSMEEMGGM